VVVVTELVKRSKSVPCNLRNKGFNFYRPSKRYVILLLWQQFLVTSECGEPVIMFI